MRRRSVLASVSGLLLAGCTGSSNGSGTTTGEPSETTTSTASPSVAGSSLEVTGSGCGSSDAGGASVSFDAGSVSVRGTVVGNNGCYRARLADVSYDAGSDTCRVVVEAFDASDPDDMCTQCITTVEYEATVEFDGGLPGVVEVVHDDMGGRSTVADASP